MRPSASTAGRKLGQIPDDPSLTEGGKRSSPPRPCRGPRSLTLQPVWGAGEGSPMTPSLIAGTKPGFSLRAVPRV